ncbi:YphA family membrane protein [Paenibacillus flagellatus]|uniref:Uncharacterized protein n=1 Tax=Paenibacillus flagellatus TaxID=2211139 RepID=A0A2V5KTC5_9BACL|nr:hypothetical protein [Paenibacillus flagellatus]PYI54957.1 hypothetical protein DLM86_10440 [Paenibacillus flagellatus]
MNPGFLCWILICISLILLASGWKRTLLRDIPDPAIVLFFVGWCALGRLQLPLTGYGQANGIVLLLAVVVAAVWARQRTALAGLHAVSFGLFLASVYYLLKHLGEVDPFFLPYRSGTGTSCVLGLIAALLVRRPQDQIACISFAMLVGSALYAIVHRERYGVSFGGLTFQDDWWMAIFAVRLLSVAGETAAGTVRDASKSLANRWKGLKK